MKVLIISSRFPYPLDKGDKLRLYYQIKELSKHFEIVLISIVDDTFKSSDKIHLEAFCHRLYTFRISKLSSGISTLKSILLSKQIPAQTAYFYHSGINKKFQKILDEEAPDHIYCQLLRVAPYVANRTIPKTLDYMDAFSTGALLRSQSGSILHKWFWKREHKKLKLFEKNQSQLFKHLTIISELDKKRLELGRDVQVIHNGIDNRFYNNHSNLSSFDAVFVGNLGYYPNAMAVNYIAKKIIPGFKEIYKKELSVNIVGPLSEKLLHLQSPQLKISGYYENVIDGYNSGKIFLAPLFKGIGQQNKILEAMAIGLPCIATSDVAEALHLEHKVNVLVANDVYNFCHAINELLSDGSLYSIIQKNARQLVERKFQWDKVCRPLIELIKNS